MNPFRTAVERMLTRDGWRWEELGACSGTTEPEVFFPPSPPGKAYMAALRAAYCDHCTVRAECKAEGEAHEFGVWGGAYMHRGMRGRR